MAGFKNVLRVLWAAAGLMFIWFDIKYFENTSLAPTFWLILGILAFAGAIIGLTGGIGAALIAQGILKYKQNTLLVLGKIVFEPGFTLFDKAAHAFFIAYGILLVIMQIRKSIRLYREKKTD